MPSFGKGLHAPLRFGGELGILRFGAELGQVRVWCQARSG